MPDGNNTCQVAIIGAGPYGLATAAHLRARGVETRVFGEPMEFWERHMPKGMFLRSAPSASSLDDPAGRLGLGRYRALHGLAQTRPVPIEDFIRYGLWFQREAVPDVDRRRVTDVAMDGREFRVRLNDGDEIRARRVVVATGIGLFAKRPAQFDGLPAALVSHSFEHADMRRFAGRRVVVIGAGQSALEGAALLHEGGATVEVVARLRRMTWLLDPSTHSSVVAAARRFLGRYVRPPFDIMGPRVVSWLIAWPRMYRRAPAAVQDFLTARAVHPIGSAWLKPRLASVPITLGQTVVTATPTSTGLRLRLSDGTERVVDHVLLGTGYRVDVDRYPFFAPDLRQALRTVHGYPDLDVGFESSVPGLHFVGTPAAATFGPLCRFVVGTSYVARAVAAHITSARGNGRSVAPARAPARLVPAEEGRLGA